MIGFALVVAIFVALQCPDTKPGQFALYHLVKRPAQWLNGLNPARTLVSLGIAIFLYLLFASFPGGLGFVLAGDMLAYIEVLTLFAVAGASIVIRPTLNSLRSLANKGGRLNSALKLYVRHVRRTCRHVRLPTTQDNEDGEGAYI